MRSVGEVRKLDARAATDLDRSTEDLLFDALGDAVERLPVAPGSFATSESHLQQLRQDVPLHNVQRRHGAGAIRFCLGDAVYKRAREGAVDVDQSGPLRGEMACTTEIRQHVAGKRAGGVPRLARLHALGLVPDEQWVVDQPPIEVGLESQTRGDGRLQRPSLVVESQFVYCRRVGRLYGVSKQDARAPRAPLRIRWPAASMPRQRSISAPSS